MSSCISVLTSLTDDPLFNDPLHVHFDHHTLSARCNVEFGHNTFDLVGKLVSARLVTEGYLRVLTTDAEFFSFNRLMKQLVDEARPFPISTCPLSVCSLEYVRPFHSS